MQTKVCHVIKLDKLSGKLNIRLLVQEEHGFPKGAQCAPCTWEFKNSLPWTGLSLLKVSSQNIVKNKWRVVVKQICCMFKDSVIFLLRIFADVVNEYLDGYIGLHLKKRKFCGCS